MPNRACFLASDPPEGTAQVAEPLILSDMLDFLLSLAETVVVIAVGTVAPTTGVGACMMTADAEADGAEVGTEAGARAGVGAEAGAGGRAEVDAEDGAT